ncbi:MAG: aldehyde dehydrogenase family protein [Burkholderiaceae bacterium]|jgi:aldehyde dehydrogenase (NAD+)
MPSSLANTVHALFKEIGAELPAVSTGFLRVHSPIDGSLLANLDTSTSDRVSEAADMAAKAFLAWRRVPAPQRGNLVRVFGEKVRTHKAALGRMISIETGKILQEGLGEVQEVIDICEFAVGLSRQLYGLSIASERADHKLLETWHPLGPTAIISAFNFPMAVWAWNASLALVCGNTIIWKPSEKTPLCALALHALLEDAARALGHDPAGLSSVVIGDGAAGEQLVEHAAIKLVSATGSTGMGRAVGQTCARLFKRALLELGGNNAAILAPSANLELAVRAITFSAVGTAGQRCTSLRRLIVHESIYPQVVEKLEAIYRSIPIGNPLEPTTLVGPLIDAASFHRMQVTLENARALEARTHFGERVEVAGEQSYYVRPALVEMDVQRGPMLEETFAPILYLCPYEEFAAAIELNNAVKHGLSSSVFTTNVQEAEQFLSAYGSDCGIANVNIGTSGAEIGGAFGGEKETGGGRESGSDAWKGYMRRATNTINYGSALPLAQGIRFDV